MKFSLYFIVLFLSAGAFGQEVVVRTKFAVRDFKIKDNTLIYIEKRDIKSFNLNTKKPDTLFKNNSFFIGGYGLNIFYPKDTNKIVTASNELVRNISSIRFYDLQKKEVNKYHVHYNTELMDFLLLPNKEMFFLSKKNKTIEVFKYGGKPLYNRQQVIDLDSYARKLRFSNDKLYYITDSGKLFEYSIQNKNKKLLYQGDNILTNFVLDSKNEFAYIATISGEVIKVNLTNQENLKLKMSEEIIEAIEIANNNIIVGDWTGSIFIIKADKFKLFKQFKLKKRIIKIRSVQENTFYTSSADKTIRRWSLIDM